MTDGFRIDRVLSETAVSRLYAGQCADGSPCVVHEIFLRAPEGTAGDVAWGLLEGEAAFVRDGRPCARATSPGATRSVTGDDWFQREVLKLCQVSSPLLPRVLAAGVRQGRGLLVFEGRGETLAERIARTGPVSCEEAEQLFVQLIDSVTPLHQGRVPTVFGEISPDNLYPREDGSLRALHCGELRFVDPPRRPDVLEACPLSASPERRRNALEGPFSDLFSIGATVYFVLTGQRARADADSSRPVDRINPQVSRTLAEAVMTCLAGKPEKRYADTDELRAALAGRQPARLVEVVPMISVDRPSIHEQGVPQGTQVSGWIQVSNVGGGTLAGRVNCDVPWLTVSPRELRGNSEQIQYWVATSKLSTGVPHEGHILVGVLREEDVTAACRGQKMLSVPVTVVVGRAKGGLLTGLGCVFRLVVPLLIVGALALVASGKSVADLLKLLGLK